MLQFLLMKHYVYSVSSEVVTPLGRVNTQGAQGGRIMAKFEHEGYCPCIWVPMTWDENTDPRLIGLWSLVGASIVYEMEDEYKCPIDTEACNKVFGIDVIAYDVLSAIIKKKSNADKIKVHQLHNGACNRQKTSDIQKVMEEVTNPELVVHAGSNFVVLLADADYGLDVWVWDLCSSW